MNSKVLLVLAVVFLLSGCSVNGIFTKTLQWSSLDDLIAAGWEPHNSNATQYNSPTQMDSKLEALNGNFTDKIWGWKATTSDDTNWFRLDWVMMPEYCGMVKATLSIKLYFTGNETRNYMWPWLGPRLHYYMHPIPVVQWQTFSIDLNVPEGGFFQFRYYANAGELVVIDEVSLNYSAEEGRDCTQSVVFGDETMGST